VLPGSANPYRINWYIYQSLKPLSHRPQHNKRLAMACSRPIFPATLPATLRPSTFMPVSRSQLWPYCCRTAYIPCYVGAIFFKFSKTWPRPKLAIRSPKVVYKTIGPYRAAVRLPYGCRRSSTVGVGFFMPPYG
jgi:hypothetical protein